MGKIINYLNDLFPLVTLVLPIRGNLVCCFSLNLWDINGGKEPEIKVV